MHERFVADRCTVTWPTLCRYMVFPSIVSIVRNSAPFKVPVMVTVFLLFMSFLRTVAFWLTIIHSPPGFTPRT